MEPTPAPIGRRALAALIDVVLLGVAFLAGAGGLFVFANPGRAIGLEVVYLAVGGAAVGVLLLAQAALLALRGQTVGKLLLGLRVSRPDGAPAGFVRAVLLRALPVIAVPALLVWIAQLLGRDGAGFPYDLLFLLDWAPPLLTAALLVADGVAALLPPGGRSVRDRLAGTIVQRA